MHVIFGVRLRGIEILGVLNISSNMASLDVSAICFLLYACADQMLLYHESVVTSYGIL